MRQYIVKNYTSSGASDTEKIAGEILALLLRRRKSAAAKVLALVGELGSGKTVFARGLAKSLSVREKILSPTFVIMKVFRLHKPRFNVRHLVHIDSYRLGGPRELLELGFENLLRDKDALIVIEWAEKIKAILPKNTIWAYFESPYPRTRKITVKIPKVLIRQN